MMLCRDVKSGKCLFVFFASKKLFATLFILRKGDGDQKGLFYYQDGTTIAVTSTTNRNYEKSFSFKIFGKNKKVLLQSRFT